MDIDRSMETNNATKYLRKYGPTGTFTSINAPYGQPMTIENLNPFLGVYGNTEVNQIAYNTALSQYKARKRTNRAGEVFYY